jgi:hypothetical protein
VSDKDNWTSDDKAVVYFHAGLLVVIMGTLIGNFTWQILRWLVTK